MPNYRVNAVLTLNVNKVFEADCEEDAIYQARDLDIIDWLDNVHVSRLEDIEVKCLD